MSIDYYYDGDVDDEEEFFKLEIEAEQERKFLIERKQNILKQLEFISFDDPFWERIRLVL